MVTANIETHTTENALKPTKVLTEDRHKGGSKIRGAYQIVYWLTKKGILRIFDKLPDIWYDYSSKTILPPDEH